VRSSGPMRRLWSRVATAVAWTPPTSTEIGTVAKSGLAAGVSWWIAETVSSEPSPVLAALSSLVVVQVSVRASIATALQRSAAVVLGVLLAVAIGDALTLNGITVALIVGASLGVAELALRLPRSAARQVPISGLVVLSAVAASPGSSGWYRALDTLIGAAVGVVVTLVLPASRLVDTRQTLDRLGVALGEELETIGAALEQPWTTEQTREWRRIAHTVRDRLVDQATEAVGSGRESARWNVRDRRHVEALGRYEDLLARLERSAIGVWVIARSLDDQARVAGDEHGAIPAMGALLVSTATAIRAAVGGALGQAGTADLGEALAEARRRRERCVRGATRRARLALDQDARYGDPLEGEWLGYASVLVQVDRILNDLAAGLPDPRA
jgi:Fusaric acid resistance protein-like